MDIEPAESTNNYVVPLNKKKGKYLPLSLHMEQCNRIWSGLLDPYN